MRRRKHTTDTQQTHAHTLLFFLQREFVTRRSLRARRWSLRASRRSPDRWPRRWSRRFRHVTTSLSWDRSKRRPARSYGLQLDERASTMVLGSAGGPPRGLAVFALLLHEADRSFDAAMPTSSRWRPRGTPDACSKPQAAGNMVARCESEHVELEPRKVFPVHEGAGCTNDTCRNLKATKRILPQPLVARHVQTLRRSAHASS